MFIKIKLLDVYLNPYKSLLFYSSKIRNILCSDERGEGEYQDLSFEAGTNLLTDLIHNSVMEVIIGV